MANSLPGKLLKVTVNGLVLRCQTDATLTLTANLTEDDACKPENDDADAGASWITRTVDSKDWTISFSAKAFADNIAGSNIDLVPLWINGDLSVEVQFLTNPSQTTYPYGFVIEGSGIMNSLTFNAPVAGSATYDTEISGNGPLTYTPVPVTT
jgi:hypothetical protein